MQIINYRVQTDQGMLNVRHDGRRLVVMAVTDDCAAAAGGSRTRLCLLK